MFWLFGIFALSAEFLKRKPEDYLSLYFFNLKKYAFNLCYFWLFNLIIYLFNYLHHHFLLSYVTHQTYCSTAKASLLTYLCYFLSKSKAATIFFFWAENLITPSFVRPVLRPPSRNAPSPRLLPTRAPAQPLHAWLDPRHRSTSVKLSLQPLILDGDRCGAGRAIAVPPPRSSLTPASMLDLETTK